jgi:ribonuclease E
MAMELPSGALAKVGAGTAAAAVAGAAGVPLVADAVRADAPPPTSAAIERTVTAQAPRASTAPERAAAAGSASLATARRRAAAAGVRRSVQAATRRPARVVLPAQPDRPPARARVTPRRPAPAPAPAPLRPAPAPAPAPASASAPAPAPAAPSAVQLAMEFGP